MSVVSALPLSNEQLHLSYLHINEMPEQWYKQNNVHFRCPKLAKLLTNMSQAKWVEIFPLHLEFTSLIQMKQKCIFVIKVNFDMSLNLKIYCTTVYVQG